MAYISKSFQSNRVYSNGICACVIVKWSVLVCSRWHYLIWHPLLNDLLFTSMHSDIKLTRTHAHTNKNFFKGHLQFTVHPFYKESLLMLHQILNVCVDTPMYLGMHVLLCDSFWWTRCVFEVFTICIPYYLEMCVCVLLLLLEKWMLFQCVHSWFTFYSTCIDTFEPGV